MPGQSVGIPLAFMNSLFTCCQIGPMSKICGASSLWATVACAAVDPPASWREEQSYNLQRGEEKQSVKNNEKCPVQSQCVRTVFFKSLMCCFVCFSHSW